MFHYIRKKIVNVDTPLRLEVEMNPEFPVKAPKSFASVINKKNKEI